MSRSYKHAKFVAISCADSDKPAKMRANRLARRKTRQLVNAGREECAPRKGYEVVNPYDLNKEGKYYVACPHAKDIRK